MSSQYGHEVFTKEHLWFESGKDAEHGYRAVGQSITGIVDLYTTNMNSIPGSH